MATNGHSNGVHRPPTAPKHIIIVGGSLGGLSCGVALKSLGVSTTILERNPSSLLHNQGAGIVAGGDTLAFFKQYDRCQRPMAVQAKRGHIYLNREGEIVHSEKKQPSMTSWDLTYYLLRANYDGVKSVYCTVPEPREGDGKVDYRYDAHVTSIAQEAEQVKVIYKRSDGSEESIIGDLVVGADGPSSTVRKLFVPDVQRSLTGYCALRGTVPETEASPEAFDAFRERFTFFHAEGEQILAYLIPGINGTVEPGKRLINFVWYHNFPLDSVEFKELMTDDEGVHHRITMPPGKMNKDVAENIKRIAEDKLPPQFAEIVRKTGKPFAQAVTDVISPTNGFLNNKVLLIGDALAGFRPHTVASTSQAAYDAMVLADMVAGRKSTAEFLAETMMFARHVQRRGLEMGNRSQFGKDVPLKDHINDRNVASTPREKEIYPEWVREGLPAIA